MPMTDSFQLFSFMHLATIAIIFVIGFIFAAIARMERCRNWVKPMRWFLVAVLLGNELIFITIAMCSGRWSYTWGIPLQLCDLAILAVAYSLIKHNQFIWEIAYFWGLGGTMQAVLTPDIQATFPDYIYFKFFLTHGSIVAGVIFLSAGCGRPIHLRSVWRVWLTTNVYAVFIMVFNWLFQTNYLYLSAKPSQTSILDYMGPWPWYILSLEGILIVSLFLCYLPYYMAKKIA